jgi:hypothetical protein
MNKSMNLLLLPIDVMSMITDMMIILHIIYINDDRGQFIKFLKNCILLIFTSKYIFSMMVIMNMKVRNHYLVR